MVEILKVKYLEGWKEDRFSEGVDLRPNVRGCLLRKSSKSQVYGSIAYLGAICLSAFKPFLFYFFFCIWSWPFNTVFLFTGRKIGSSVRKLSRKTDPTNHTADFVLSTGDTEN